MMPASTARALSMALIGGILTVLYYREGLLVWAGLIGWAGFVEAGGDASAMKKSLAGNLLGAFLAWVALVMIFNIAITTGSWLWMPRTGGAIAFTLLLLGLAARWKGGSNLPPALCGYAAVIGAAGAAVQPVAVGQGLIALHQYNPLINALASMVGGAIAGFAAMKLADGMTKK